MAFITRKTCWVFSCFLMLWVPRLTLIELSREQMGVCVGVQNNRKYNAGAVKGRWQWGRAGLQLGEIEAIGGPGS